MADNTNLFSSEVIREKVQDGVTGESKEISYTQCKIVGNGSFGVVFQTKMAPSGEDAAIKRVLQDKRFKVHGFSTWDLRGMCVCRITNPLSLSRTVNCKSCGLCAILTLSNSKPFTTPTATGYVSPGCPARSSFRPPFPWADRAPEFPLNRKMKSTSTSSSSMSPRRCTAHPVTSTNSRLRCLC